MLGHDPIIQNHDDAAIALRPDQATGPLAFVGCRILKPVTLFEEAAALSSRSKAMTE